MKHLIFMALAASLLTFGCKKEEEVVKPDRGRSYVHLLGAVDTDTFNVTIDYYNSNDVVITDFYYHRNFPILGYADFEAGGTPDEFGNGKLFVTLSRQPFSNVAPDTIMTAKELVFERDAQTTVCFVDSFGTKMIAKFDDAVPAADPQNALVRFLNLSAPVTNATLSTTDGSANIGGITFMNQSTYTSVAPGQHTFEVKDGGGNVVATVDVQLSPSIIYTFYVSGSSTKQVRYFVH